jgi:putative ABC transport system permease protein
MDFGQSPFGVPIALDRGLFAYALGLSAAGGLIFGSLPTFAAMRLDLRQLMADSSKGVSSGRARGFSGSAIVVTEFALAFVLVASTLLMLESLEKLAEQQRGFEPEGILTARVTLPDPPYGDCAGWTSSRGRYGVASKPWVTDAAAVSASFADRRHSVITQLRIDRYPEEESELSAYVSPRLLRGAADTALRGRFLSETDRPDTQRVVVVDKQFVERGPLERRHRTEADARNGPRVALPFEGKDTLV